MSPLNSLHREERQVIILTLQRRKSRLTVINQLALCHVTNSYLNCVFRSPQVRAAWLSLGNVRNGGQVVIINFKT